MTRHFCYEGDDCAECVTVDLTPDPDLSWVTLAEVPAPIVWPWWLAVPAARLGRLLRGVR